MNPLRWLAVQFPSLFLARRNLARAPSRSILAVIAIVIGVVAIGAIGTGGEAFKQDQLEAYEGFGGTATVEPVFYPEDNDPADRTFSDREIARMRQATPEATILPVIESFGPLVRTPSGQTITSVQVTGIGNPGTFYEAQSGAIPDNWRRTVIVGSRVAETNDLHVGDRLTVRLDGVDRPYRIAAILEPQGFADPLNADRAVFLPLVEFEGEEYDQAILQINPARGSVDDAKGRLEAAFNGRERRIRVEPVQEQREQFESFFATINQFLIGVGAISLLVAAVTIANTMLMAVIEREGEIGLMRAFGFPRMAVIRLLVIEATILGSIGSIVGGPITLGIGMVINQFLVGDPLAFTETGLRYVAMGMGFGVMTALLAGLYPAWRAANKPPVEALHG